ncbi:MAG: energy-coupling factor transporter transmembrane component T [Roseburia sp.]
MENGILQTSVQNRGMLLDPRTKMLLLFTMAVFVLGYSGGELLQFLTPCFCILPAVFLLTARKYRTAFGYILMYSASFLAFTLWGDKTSGILNFLLLGICGILARFLPCMMMGAYMISTTTVSEFTAAMQRMHLSDKIIIPLSVMFRFFPTVIDEFVSINSAMKMRDIRIGGKNFSKMFEYRIVPLMTCCVKIGEELSAAALTRGLGGTVHRTNICRIGFRIQDILVILLCLVPLVLLSFQTVGIL